MNNSELILILIIVFLPFVFSFLLVIIFNIKFIILGRKIKKYPVYKKMLINLFPENQRNVGKMFRVLFAGFFSFVGLSKSRFDKYFNELYSYNSIKKIKNKEISNSMEFLKKIFRISTIIGNIYLGIILLIGLLIVIILILGLLWIITLKIRGQI